MKRTPLTLNMENTLDEIKELAISGLLTDGGHHKQWFLEEILKKLGINLTDLKETLEKEDYSWEPGIVP